MAYTRVNWLDNVTPLDQVNLNQMDAGIAALDAAATGTVAGKVDKDSVVAAATRLVASKLLAGDAQPAFNINGLGTTAWGAGGAAALDTVLYRSGPGALKTDGSFEAVGRITDSSLPNHLIPAAAGSTTPIADANLATKNGWYFLGNAGANLPSAADWMVHVSAFSTGLLTQEARSIYTLETWRRPTASGAWTKVASADGSPVSPGIMYFGTVGDTSLYRPAAGQLQTPGIFAANGVIYASSGASGQILLNSNGYIYFGNLADTFFGRAAAGVLGTAGDLVARYGAAEQVYVGTDGSGRAAVRFGNAFDTTLFRQTAGVLRTPGTLDANALTINGVPVGGGTGTVKSGFIDGASNFSGPWLLTVNFPTAFATVPNVVVTLDATGLGYADVGAGDYTYDTAYPMSTPRVVAVSTTAVTFRIEASNPAYTHTGVRLRWVAAAA